MKQRKILALILLASFLPFSLPVKADSEVKYFRNKVGIMEPHPDAELHVKGGVIIRDGTQGSNRYFASDANGKGSWKTLAQLPNFGVTNNTVNNVTINDSILNSSTFSNITIDNATIVDSHINSMTVNNLTVNNDFISAHHPWKLVHRDTFQTATSGWNINTRTTCRAGNFILGGYNVTSNTVLSKTFSLAGIPHTHVMIRFNPYYVDSWDNERAFLEVDGARRWLSEEIRYDNDGSTHLANCGNSNTGNVLHKDSSSTETVIMEHTGNNLFLRFRAQLNSAATEESFGIDNLEIYVMDSSNTPKLVPVSAGPAGACTNQPQGRVLIGPNGLLSTESFYAHASPPRFFNHVPGRPPFAEYDNNDDYPLPDWEDEPFQRNFKHRTDAYNEQKTADAFCRGVSGAANAYGTITATRGYSSPSDNFVWRWNNTTKNFDRLAASGLNSWITGLECRCGEPVIQGPSENLSCNASGEFHIPPAEFDALDGSAGGFLGGGNHAYIDWRRCDNQVTDARVDNGGIRINFIDPPRPGPVKLTINFGHARLYRVAHAANITGNLPANFYNYHNDQVIYECDFNGTNYNCNVTRIQR